MTAYGISTQHIELFRGNTKRGYSLGGILFFMQEPIDKW